MTVSENPEATETGKETADDLQVWQVDLRQPTAWMEAAAARLLTADERERGERGTPEVRRRRLVSSIALRIALSRWLECAPESLTLVRDHAGKPRLSGGGADGSLHFNLSRSGDYCFIALTQVGPVGVDVERLVAIPDLEEIAVARFAVGEASTILRLSGDQQLRAFYRCWTRKEAYLKARGTGLAGGLDEVVVTVEEQRPAILALPDGNPADWALCTILSGPNVVGAVMLSSPDAPRGGVVEPNVLHLETGTG